MELLKTNEPLKAHIRLPASKSISNRMLMIQAYASQLPDKLKDVSEADDSQMLYKNLKLIQNCTDSSIPMVIDCGNAGTVFRFLLTYLATKPGLWMLTGTIRMKSRPIADLVDSLRKLGASISYVEEEGFPPLKILGKRLNGGTTRVSMEKSSQFASSLLMAAPLWEKGLELELDGNLSSMPYLDMTVQLMQQNGAKLKQNTRLITVFPFPYQLHDSEVEADWSSAAFWYELVALSENGELFLKGLHSQSLQGDKIMQTFFSMLGVTTFEEADGILIFKTPNEIKDVDFNLKDYPDMLPALAASCCGLGVNATFSGLHNLQYKESNRTAALQTELKKIGCRFEKISGDSYMLTPKKLYAESGNTIAFNTYGDHRLAMAFAPLVMKLERLKINSPEVVEKSYPTYWEELFKTQVVSRA